MGVIGEAALVSAFAAGIFCLLLLKFKKSGELGLKTGICSAAFVLAASAVLLFLLISGDYSIDYVLRNTGRDLPLIYRISAFWSGSAGSLLLWGSCNSIVYLLIRLSYYVKKNGERKYLSFLTATVTALNLGFLAVLLFVSSPFGPALPGGGGFGLNPSLQSIGMVVHPPLVMLAYSCIFAALAAGLSAAKTPGGTGIHTIRKTALIGWIALTAGIVSGGVWAYRELGWGGYWSWDPIENSALATWLLLTAYLHRPDGRAAPLLISAAAFSSLFGTILARSGVLGSVHSYSAHSGRIFFFVVTALLLAGCLAAVVFIYGGRKKTGRSTSGFSRLKRYLPQLLPAACAAAIALMTVAPLAGITIPEKTYDLVFGIYGLLLLPASALVFSFRHAGRKAMAFIAAISAVFGAAVFILPSFSAYPVFTRVELAVCIFCLAFVVLSAASGMNGLTGGKYFAAFVLHVSVVVIALGLIGTRGMKLDTSAAIYANDTVIVGSHALALNSLSVDDGPLIKTWTADFTYTNGKRQKDIEASFQLYKQKGIYHSKACVVGSPWEDLCIIIENAADDGAVLLKVAVFKWIWLLWAGVVLMVSASLFLLGKEYVAAHIKK